MTLHSLTFAGFVLVVLAGHYALPRRWQNAWLLLASYAFAASADGRFALVLGLVTAANYALGRAVRRANRARPAVLWAGVGLNLAALAYFRLTGFFAPALAALMARSGLPGVSGFFDLAAPLGLSYYALQAISHLVEVARGQLPPAASVVDFALYLAYFPKLVAGPIERPGPFLAQLGQARTVDNAQVERSLARIGLGLFRKLVLADLLMGVIPALAFHRPFYYTRADTVVSLVAYAFALYNDFAGYTDLARGVSGLFGLELSPNFAQPFFARSFGEFWNRWHITLSHWLRDYIFYPFSRALRRWLPQREHLAHLVLPPLVVMLVSARWHADWTHMMVMLWGGMHGLYLAGERLAQRGRPTLPPDQWPRWRQAAGMLLVFVLTLLAWVPFHEGTGLWHTLMYWRTLVLGAGGWGLDWRVPALAAVSLGLDWLQARGQDELFFLRWPRPARVAVATLAVLLIFIALKPNGAEPFVYQGF